MMWEWLYLLIIIPVAIILVYLLGFIAYPPLHIWEKWIDNGIGSDGDKMHITIVVLGILIVGFIFLLEAQGVSFGRD